MSPRSSSKLRADSARRQARSRSLLHPLRDLAADFRDRMRAGLRDRGHAALQPAHSGVIVNLRTEGTRLTELAERAGISKQAMGKLVAEMEDIGYVRCAPDPVDARAKLVTFSRSGLGLLADAGTVVDDIWELYAGLIGERRLSTLRSSLLTLLAKLDEHGEGERADAPESGPARTGRTRKE